MRDGAGKPETYHEIEPEYKAMQAGHVLWDNMWGAPVAKGVVGK